MVAGCGLREGPVECQEKMKDVIISNPVEECHMKPIKTCKMVTKLVPGLKPVQECVDVPKEVCATNRVNPHLVKKPSIMKWCYTPPTPPSTPTPTPTPAPPPPPAQSPEGKVQVNSILVQCSDCPEVEVTVTLFGERTLGNKKGVPCTSATVRLEDSLTEFSGTETDRGTLGTCWKVND